MTYTELWQRLATVYEANEAKAIVRYVLEARFGLSAADVYCGKVTQLSSDDTTALEKIMQRLLLSEPVQYILREATFDGHTFKVAPGVLIPRPETEELVEVVSCAVQAMQMPAPTILDVGTGCGCIAISLALRLDSAMVSAWDISPQAISIAKTNAVALQANVDICCQDALNPPADNLRWDVIVSNPPYICEKEKNDIERNVLDYEPATALFVPDANPLLFYRSIAQYACCALKRGGGLFFEINPDYASEMKKMLEEMGYGRVKIMTDLFGKRRMAIAYRK